MDDPTNTKQPDEDSTQRTRDNVATRPIQDMGGHATGQWAPEGEGPSGQRHIHFLFYHYARTGGTGYNIDFARDLVMIALEKAFEKIRQYDPKGGEFMTWVYTIANNTRTDYHRKNIKLVSIDEPIKINEEELLIEIEGQGPSPMDIALKNERGEQVKTAVAALSNPKERHLIYLRYFEQLSYDEIAEEMEMPLGTVKAMLFRAKENLQELLSPEMLVRA